MVLVDKKGAMAALHSLWRLEAWKEPSARKEKDRQHKNSINSENSESKQQHSSNRINVDNEHWFQQVNDVEEK